MSNISILDCTLREGGYVNEWNFGFDGIIDIIQDLSKAGVEYIECGFLNNCIYDSDFSLFDSVDRLKNIINSESKSKYTLMINYGEYPIDKVPENDWENLCIRVAFKKKNRYEALKYCKQLKQKGYNVFVNSMVTNSYSKSELEELLTKINNIKPYAYTLSDTFGNMQKNDILMLFNIVDKKLLPEIKLAFHSHNNMQLAVANSQLFLEQNTKRDIIIDSTLMGIGRGAGNLSTEMIAKYLNFQYGNKYNIEFILNLIEKQIQPIYKKTPWGYSIPYYLAAVNNCHPNYARFLIEETNITVENQEKILKAIPDENKMIYDKNLIKKICSQN